MGKCNRNLNTKEQKSLIDNSLLKLVNMFSRSFIRLIIFIWWILLFYLFLWLFYIVIIKYLWLFLNLPINPLTNAFFNVAEFPMDWLARLASFYIGIVGGIFIFCWFITKLFDATVIFGWLPYAIHPIFNALLDEKIFELFDVLFNWGGKSYTTSYKIQKMYQLSPFYNSSIDQGKEQEVEIEEVDFVPIDPDIIPSLTSLFILKNDGLYINNQSRRKLGNKIEEYKEDSNIQISTSNNTLSEEQKRNIDRCILQSCKSNLPNATLSEKLSNSYDNGIIQSNCEVKYDGRNRCIVQNDKENIQKSYNSVKNTLNTISKIFGKNDFDYY